MATGSNKNGGTKSSAKNGSSSSTSKSSSKNSTKKTSTSAATKAAKAEESRIKAEFSRASTAILQLLVGIFIGISIVSALFDSQLTGVVGEFARKGVMGIFGTAGILVPLALIYSGFINAFGKRSKSYAARKAAAVVLVITLSGFLALFAPEVEGLPALYEQGHTLLISGGVIGGKLTEVLMPLFQTVGVVLIYIASALLCLVVLSNMTIEKLLRSLFPEMRKPEKAKPSEKPSKKETTKETPPEPAPTVSPEPALLPTVAEKPAKAGGFFGKRNKKIDIDIDDTTQTPTESASPQPTPTPIPTPKTAILPETSALPIPPEFTVHTHKEPQPEQGMVAENPEKIEMSKAEIDIEIAEVAKAAESIGEGAPYVYRVPPISLLAPDVNTGRAATDTEVKLNSVKIIETLRSFGVEATLLGASQGPTVTRYELAPAAGVKISKITNLSDDLALSLAAMGVRIEAPIPGKAAIGIEVPNKNVSTVYLRSVIESAAFRTAKSPLSFAIGKDIAGAPVVGDIAKMPHVLIAGATGAGKSVCINSLLISLLYKSSPEELRLIMVDPKVVELGGYNGIPHLLIPVVTDPRKAAGALSWAVGEMLKRYNMFAEKGVKDITGYNLLAPGDDEVTALPRIVIIIDELADLMMVAPGEVEDSIMRLAQMARAAGMHLVIATQRPTVNVITGTIKANIPSRIAFAVSSQIDSRTILDAAGAEKLIGKGDMLYYPMGAPKPLRIQGCLVVDKEVEAIVEAIKAQGHESAYDNDVMVKIEEESKKTEKGKKGADMGGADAEDEMFMPAVDFVVESGNASASMLQRRLKLGYARAARLVDEMEQRGIVGPPDGSKPRQVLITRSEWQEMVMRRAENP